MSEGTPMDSISVARAISLRLVPVHQRVYNEYDTIQFREKGTEDYSRVKSFDELRRRASTYVDNQEPMRQLASRF